MELRFIGQGTDPESDITTGNFIIDSLESGNYNTFNAFVAFVSTGGLKNIIDQLIAFKNIGKEIKLYVGVDLNATSKEALEKLIELKIETYVIYSPNNIIYHPKIYAFEGAEMKRAIVGSSNLTASGLFQNIEASVCVDFDTADENGNEFLADIYDHFNTIINQEHSSCRLLTQEVLEILIESKVVLPELVNRAKNNKIKKEFGQKDTVTNTRLLALFGKVRVKRPPKGFGKAVVKKEFVTEEGTAEVILIDETTDLTSGAMWVETREMTGGSRNILDLSKSGRLDGVAKFGSVEYFGINPVDYDSTVDVDIHFGGSVYKGNTVFYPIGENKNGTWRIRLNGETDNGAKLTTFSIPSLGQNGGFQHKILLFTRLDATNFRLEILEKDDMPRLIENSANWSKGGKGGTGRAYGIITVE